MIPEERVFFGYFVEDKIEEGLAYLETHMPPRLRARYKADINRNEWFGATFDHEITTALYKEAADLGDPLSMVEYDIFTDEGIFRDHLNTRHDDTPTLYAKGVWYSVYRDSDNPYVQYFKDAVFNGCLGSMHQLLEDGFDQNHFATELLKAGYFFAYPDIAAYYGRIGISHKAVKLWKRLMRYQHGESCYMPVRFLSRKFQIQDALVWLCDVSIQRPTMPDDIERWASRIAKHSMSPVELYYLGTCSEESCIALSCPAWDRVNNTAKVWNQTIRGRIRTFIGVLRRKYPQLGRDMHTLLAQHIWAKRLDDLKWDNGWRETRRNPNLVLPPLKDT